MDILPWNLLHLVSGLPRHKRPRRQTLCNLVFVTASVVHSEVDFLEGASSNDTGVEIKYQFFQHINLVIDCRHHGKRLRIPLQGPLRQEGDAHPDGMCNFNFDKACEFQSIHVASIIFIHQIF